MKARNKLLAALLTLVMTVGILAVCTFAEADPPGLSGHGSNNDQEQPADYTVTLNADPAGVGMLEGSGSYAAGTEITVKATHTTSYIFDGWYIAGTKVSSGVREGTGSTYTYTFTVEEDVSLTAKFKLLSTFSDLSMSPGRTVFDQAEEFTLAFGLMAGNEYLSSAEYDKVTLSLNGAAIGERESVNEFALSASDLNLGPNELILSYPGSEVYSARSRGITITVVNKLALQLEDFAPAHTPVNTSYTVSGRIVDENGDPCGDRTVRVFVQKYENNYVQFTSIGAQTTDENGCFSCEISEDLPSAAGSRLVWIQTEMTDTHKSFEAFVAVQFTEPAASIDITLTNAGATAAAPGWYTGDTGTASASVLPAGALQEVEWSASADGVTVDQDGNIVVAYFDADQAVGAPIIITAAAKDGSGVSATKQITVYSHGHTVTFDPGEGGGYMTSAWVPDSGRSAQYRLPPCTFSPPAGHAFKAWSVNGVEYDPGEEITLSGRCSQTEVTALWEPGTPASYSITVVTDGKGTVAAQVLAGGQGFETVQSATAGTQIVPRALPNNGYQYDTVKYSFFDGNETQERTLTSPYNNIVSSFTMPAADVTITVAFKESFYRLSGLSASPGALSPAFAGGTFEYSIAVAHGIAAIQATVTYPEHSSLDAVGWTEVSSDAANRTKTFSHALDYGLNELSLHVFGTASGHGTHYYLNVTRALPPDDMISYTVRFDPNPPGGYTVSGSMSDQPRWSEDGLALPRVQFTVQEEHFVFTGWNTSADGSGAAFGDEDARQITDEDGAAVTLYARWNRPQITTNSLSAAKVGASYSAALTQAGLTDAAWSIASGSLPSGMSLNSGTGVISGAPTEAGTFPLTVEVLGKDIATGAWYIVQKGFPLTVLPKTADLSVAVAPALPGGKTAAEKGDAVIWTLTVTNDGPDEAEGVKVEVNIPSSATGFISALTHTGAFSQTVGDEYLWDVGYLPPAEQLDAPVTLLIFTAATAEIAEDVTLYALVSGDADDPYAENNSASGSVAIATAYTVSFVNEDGAVLQSGKVVYGDTPAYHGATPRKPRDARYSYAFDGWTPQIEAVTGDAVYTATYRAAPAANDAGSASPDADGESGLALRLATLLALLLAIVRVMLGIR